MDIISEFKLEPMAGNEKSHYGKARIRQYGNGVYALVSYDTVVAAGTMAAAGNPATLYRIYDNRFERMGGWTATTGRHISSFAAFLGAEYNGKKDWTGKPYCNLADVLANPDGEAVAA